MCVLAWLTYYSSCIIYRNLARPPWWREGLLFPSIYTYTLVFFKSSLSLSSLTRRRFYPQRSSSGPVVVIGVVPSPPPVSAFIFVAHRVQYSHRSSIFIERVPYKSNPGNMYDNVLHLADHKAATRQHELYILQITIIRFLLKWDR